MGHMAGFSFCRGFSAGITYGTGGFLYIHTPLWNGKRLAFWAWRLLSHKEAHRRDFCWTSHTVSLGCYSGPSCLVFPGRLLLPVLSSPVYLKSSVVLLWCPGPRRRCFSWPRDSVVCDVSTLRTCAKTAGAQGSLLESGWGPGTV